MIYLNIITNKNNEKWPYIPDHPYRILIIGGSRSGKTKTLLNLIKGQNKYNVIDKIYLYSRDLKETKYQFVIEKRENVGIKHIMIEMHLLNV